MSYRDSCISLSQCKRLAHQFKARNIPLDKYAERQRELAAMHEKLGREAVFVKFRAWRFGLRNNALRRAALAVDKLENT